MRAEYAKVQQQVISLEAQARERDHVASFVHQGALLGTAFDSNGDDFSWQSEDLVAMQTVIPTSNDTPLPWLAAASLAIRPLFSINTVASEPQQAINPALLPDKEEARRITRAWLSSYGHTPHSLSDSELEADIEIVYGPNGLSSSAYSANRFRCFIALYIAYLVNGRGRHDDQVDGFTGRHGLVYRSLALRELPNVTAQEDLVSCALAPITLTSDLRSSHGAACRDGHP